MMYECKVTDHQTKVEVVQFDRREDLKLANGRKVSFEDYVGYITVYFYNKRGNVFFKASVPSMNFKDLSIHDFDAGISVDCELGVKK